MTGYRLTPAAAQDLSDIWDFSERSWGTDQAEAYVRSIRNVIERITDQHDLGRDVSDIRAGYRQYASGSHLVFYRENADDSVDVIRILHQRMDPERHL